MNNSVIRAAIPALVLSAIVLIPFFDKAFTIDDPVFLLEARHVLDDPLHPTAFEMVWEEIPGRVSQLVPTGPVMAWLLAPTILADGSERVAHATQLVMLWLAIIATVSLALRLELPATWASASGIMLVAMPAVLGMAGTAMPDIPAMTLGIAGIERLVAWKQDRRMHQAVSAAVLLGMAPMARPHLILLLGIGVIFILGPAPSLKDMRTYGRTLLPVFAALIITATVYFITLDPDPGAGSMVTSTVKYSSGYLPRLSSNFVAFPIHWVLAMAFALPWIALRWRTILKTPFIRIALVIGVLISGGALASIGRFSLPLSLISGIGLAVLCEVLADGWSRRDYVQLALGFWLLIALPTLPYVHLPPKYLIASAPAAAILIGRELASRRGKMATVVVCSTVVLGVMLGIAILRADETFSDLGRRAAHELIAPYVAAGQQVWFIGHWGFQWYAEEAGARHVTLTPPYPNPGDILVVSNRNEKSYALVKMIGGFYPRMTQIALLTDTHPGGRLMNEWLGAGFYSNSFGYLPWTWGSAMVDMFTVWRMK